MGIRRQLIPACAAVGLSLLCTGAFAQPPALNRKPVDTDFLNLPPVVIVGRLERVVDGTVLIASPVRDATSEGQLLLAGYHRASGPATIGDRTLWQGEVYQAFDVLPEGPSPEVLQGLVGHPIKFELKRLVRGGLAVFRLAT